MVFLQVSLQGVLLLAAEGAVGAVEGGRVEDLLVEGEEAGRGAGESAADAAGGRHLLVSRRRVLLVSLGTATKWFIKKETSNQNGRCLGHNYNYSMKLAA